MVFARKKCRILLTWILLVLFAQLLLYALLYSEFESVPRKRLSERLKLHNLQNSPLQRKLGNLGIIPKDLNVESRVKSDLTSETGNGQKVLSRKLEKVKMDNDLFSVTVPNVRTLGVKPQSDRKILVSESSRTDILENKVMFEEKSGSRVTEPEDIFISVKTTQKYHGTRVVEIRNTWLNTAKEQTYFFTDSDDSAFNQSLGGHLINTQCNTGHKRSALCCKMAYELNYFWEQTRRRWFCHFDDDNYVNFPALIKFLQQHDHSKPHYLGKTSIPRQMKTWDKNENFKEVSFWFATGGAGFCLSRELVALMVPYFSGKDAFPDTCNRIGLPDDCVIGFISEYLLNVKLKEVHLFHSHLEWLRDIPLHTFHDQVSFSHGYLGNMKNHIQINGPFSLDEDPSRFKSLHCYFHPQTDWCPNNKKHLN